MPSDRELFEAGWRRGYGTVREILADPVKKRRLMIQTIIATQAREGIVTTHEQAAAAYDKIQRETEAMAAIKEYVDPDVAPASDDDDPRKAEYVDRIAGPRHISGRDWVRINEQRKGKST